MELLYILLIILLVLFFYYNSIDNFVNTNEISNKETSDKLIITSIINYITNPINRFVR